MANKKKEKTLAVIDQVRAAIAKEAQQKPVVSQTEKEKVVGAFLKDLAKKRKETNS